MLYEPKFYKCGVCDAILESITPHCCDDLTCCGKPMELLKANELIALEEKHLPIVKREGNNLTVCVGRVLHPMSKEHSIQWIEVKSKYLEQRITLKKRWRSDCNVWSNGKCACYGVFILQFTRTLENYVVECCIMITNNVWNAYIFFTTFKNVWFTKNFIV